MKRTNTSGFNLIKFFGPACVALVTLGVIDTVRAAETSSSPSDFTGEKSSWHGFDRYDFVMDTNLSLQPFNVPAGENSGVGDPASGQRRCIIVVPKQAAPGKPWSWRGCYWDHQPQTEVGLLNRGFHIAYISANATLKPGKEWDAWYAFLTEKHGLSKKPGFIGMSRGGEYAFTWATTHPDKVSYIYADNPGGNKEMLLRLGELALNDVPLLLVCGSIDPLLSRVGLPIETIYQQWGGRVTMMIKEGAGHHPHSLRDASPLVNWIEQNYLSTTDAPPAFVGGKFTKTSYYSTESFYRYFAKEENYLTCRGPGFAECYNNYGFDLPGVEGTISVLTPKTPAAGKPWVFRSNFAGREATVDPALLAKGFHIVTGPVPYNADGPKLKDWDAVYAHLIAQGFAKKAVMEGAGGAAGEAYAWAIENPEKVACVYAENPVLQSHLYPPPMDHLAPLAKAGVPLFHVCGELDPWLAGQTRLVEKKYHELGGQITVIFQKGEGHFPTGPRDPKPVVDFITAHMP